MARDLSWRVIRVSTNKRVPESHLLYSWRFSRNSAPIHWLVHDHMTPKNETVSRQIKCHERAILRAKTMTSSGKQFTVVTREMLAAGARDQR